MSAKPDTAVQGGNGVPPLNAAGRKRRDAASILGQASQNTSSPEGAKQGGELPHGWSEQRIEQLFAPLEDGRTLHQGWSPQCDKIPSPSEDVWGVLKTTSIQAGEFRPEHNKLLPPGLEPRPMIEVKEGDILLTCAGPRVRCGVSCLVRQTRKRLMMSGKMYRFRVNPEEHDARYIEAFLQTERARRAIDKMKTGSSDSGLNLTHERFRQLPVPVPATVDEQRRIVAEIEKQFTRLEAGVAALRRVQANLKRYRAAVLKAACEGRLVPTEAELARSKRSNKNGQPAYETGEALLARILTERRQNWLARQSLGQGGKGGVQYKEPAEPDSKVHQELPEGWATCSVGQVSECLDGKRVPINKNERAKRHGDVPYYGANGQVGWIDDHLFDEPLVLVVEDETFTGRTQAFSYVIRGKTWVNNHAHVLRATAAVSTAYLNYSLAHYPFTARTTGSTGRRKLTQKALMAAPYLLPPLAEQTRIVAEVERRLSVVEELESVVWANFRRATRLRQSILRKAFTGELLR
ncbi:MAG: restriction endonuclease subunit S [Verrucomicrobiales bacterium]|nr:restriction endonuclease subunit S [Verrucomicrobiales bacterium]